MKKKVIKSWKKCRKCGNRVHYESITILIDEHVKEMIKDILANTEQLVDVYFEEDSDDK